MKAEDKVWVIATDKAKKGHMKEGNKYAVGAENAETLIKKGWAKKTTAPKKGE